MTLSSKPCFILPIVLLLLSVSYMCVCEEVSTDQVQHRTSNNSCLTTVQGRHLRSDDRGYVCKIMEVDPKTSCCPDTNDDQYSCRGCDMGAQCCNGYEFCVACCLDPMRTPNEVALKSKVAKQVTAGTSGSVFAYCRSRCRHNSGSVVHENAYASEEHHCFGRLPGDSADQGSEIEDDADFEDLTIVIGRQGQSCDAACKGRGKMCKISALRELNKCAKLKKYLNCKEACIASTGQEQPAEVVLTAPRYMHPGACMYSTGNASVSCQSSHPYSRRLCPCEQAVESM